MLYIEKLWQSIISHQIFAEERLVLYLLRNLLLKFNAVKMRYSLCQNENDRRPNSRKSEWRKCYFILFTYNNFQGTHTHILYIFFVLLIDISQLYILDFQRISIYNEENSKRILSRIFYVEMRRCRARTKCAISFHIAIYKHWNSGFWSRIHTHLDRALHYNLTGFAIGWSNRPGM